MRIILVRHGESEGNADPSNYIKYGEPNVPLTNNGWEQAAAAGKFLQSFLQKSHDEKGESGPMNWPEIWVSPFQRTRETLAGILHGIDDSAFDGEPHIRQDVRLIEMFFGLLPHIKTDDPSIEPHIRDLFNDLAVLSKENSLFQGKTPFGESPMEHANRVQSFIDSLKSRNEKEDLGDVVIVNHGHTIRHFIMAWFGLPLDAWQSLQRDFDVNNCDAYVFDQDETTGRWTVTKVYDGQDMEEVETNPLDNVAQQELTREELPPVPAFLKKGPKTP